MKTSDFYYDLPERLIAQSPLEKRDNSRFMIVDRKTGALTHRHFYDLPALLHPGDCLVLNDTRVIPARLMGVKKDTGAVIEVLLLTDRGDNVWECLTRPGRKTKPGVVIEFGGGLMTGEVLSSAEDGNKLIRFSYQGIFLEVLEQLGTMPLPPYIKEKLDDQERYQTVYSREPGSAAAPTAGLHFTKDLLGKIQEQGVKIVYVTLHVGLGTFRPVKVDDVTSHHMHSEYYHISAQAAETINAVRCAGGRVIAVGTTACRTLESAAAEDGTLSEKAEWTDIFIYPGYRFKVLDGLITNFHLPESTLIMLVSAFSSREIILNAYREAVAQEYRFFSFGDAMMLI